MLARFRYQQNIFEIVVNLIVNDIIYLINSKKSDPRSMIPEDGYCSNRLERCGKITVSGLKARESTGNWKQYFSWKLPDFFLWIPVSFLCFTSGSWSESTGKKSGNFQLEYCFHFPALSCAFRPFPAVRPRPGRIKIEINKLQ